MTTRQPEALRLAEILEGGYSLAWLYERGGYEVSAELRRQHARITELESQLAQRFDAADMATAAAQGFRDGVASVSAGSEPVAWMTRLPSGSEALARTRDFYPDAVPVYTHPSPPEGMAGRLQVYRCKIKSKKQIDKEIPREQQGWWADVAAGQKLLLRQAVQSDLDRCTLGGKRSRNPADYMCETENHGSLVSKVALEYMNPEQNVFAAAPGPADGESNG